MTKRQSHPNNGLESPAPEHRQGDGELAPAQPASASSDQPAEAEEETPQEANNPPTHEDRGASDALMESYNG